MNKQVKNAQISQFMLLLSLFLLTLIVAMLLLIIWGFVQYEQQKHQNKYGYNEKCHSNAANTNDITYHSYLSIYLYILWLLIIIVIVSLFFFLLLLLLLLRLFINSHFSLSVESDIWLGYTHIGIWKSSSFVFDQKYYPFAMNWWIWPRDRERV